MKNKFISRRDFEMYSREQGSDRQGDTFWEEFFNSEHAIDSPRDCLHFSLNATSTES